MAPMAAVLTVAAVPMAAAPMAIALHVVHPVAVVVGVQHIVQPEVHQVAPRQHADDVVVDVRDDEMPAQHVG